MRHFEILMDFLDAPIRHHYGCEQVSNNDDCLGGRNGRAACITQFMRGAKHTAIPR
jgi:hypothetical protein